VTSLQFNTQNTFIFSLINSIFIIHQQRCAGFSPFSYFASG
jgi:hypothetical protein